MKISYFKELDGVRAIAALMVMFFHFFQTMNSSDSFVRLLTRIAIFGQTGVSLFFVLSGFLITRILLSTRRNPGYFSSFYIRRSLRIFPLYYFFLVIYYLVIPFFTQTEIVLWGQQFWYWFYLQGFPMTFHWSHVGPDHFWSLAVEEHFYLFWPLLVFYSHPKKLPYVIAAIVGIALILRIVFVQHSFETFYFTLTRMDELALGALVAVFEIRNKLLPSYFRKYFFLFVLLIFPLCFVWLWNGSSANPVLQVLKYNFISLIYFLVLCFVLTSGENGLIKRVLRSQSLNFLGRISYGLYVYHPLCFFVFASSFSQGNIGLDFLGSFALTVLISTASYYFFERRFLAMKRYFDYDGKIKPVILSSQTQER